MSTNRPALGHRVPVAVPVTAALLALLALWFGAQLAAVQLGNQDWASDRFEEAEEHYSTGVDLLVLERWIAPFNRGVARHELGRHGEAAADFAAAAELAPSPRQCMVRLNWAWTLEADADARAGADPQAARTRYLEADAVLAGVDCPDDVPMQDATQSQQDQLDSTRERLETKRTGNPPSTDDEPDEQDGDQAREQELQQRQRQAQREFQEAGEDRDSEPPADGRRTW